MHVGIHAKRLLFLSNFNQNRNMSTKFSQNTNNEV